MKIDILTLFPEMFDAINHSILKRAQDKNLIRINFVQIRDFSIDKHKKVDDTPFGGGAGMVMTCQPLFDAIISVLSDEEKTNILQKNSEKHEKNSKKAQKHINFLKNINNFEIIYMSPRGEKFEQSKVLQFAKLNHLIIVCGHYEGIDQRVIDYFDMKEVSIGDFVLTGGELPAMVLVDSISRYIDGVLSEGSTNEESFSSGLLEYPQYTKPRVFQGLEVPEILTNGNHKEIAKWKLEESLKITKKNRNDLYRKYLSNQKKLKK